MDKIIATTINGDVALFESKEAYWDHQYKQMACLFDKVFNTEFKKIGQE